MLAYSKTRYPRTYNDFFEIVKSYITNNHKDRVRKLINFKLHPRYNLDKKRLKIIQERIKIILEL